MSMAWHGTEIGLMHTHYRNTRSQTAINVCISRTFSQYIYIKYLFSAGASNNMPNVCTIMVCA